MFERWQSVALILVLVSACTSEPSKPCARVAEAPVKVPSVGRTAPEKTSAVSYASTFDLLAERIDKHHVFADGRRVFWDAHKAELRRELAAAKSREEALVALRHLQLSLGDRHCGVKPPTDLRAMRLKLGFEVHAAHTTHGSVVRVSEVADPALAADILVGDEVLAVDGASIADYLKAHPFESNALNPNAALQETADTVVSQILPWSTVVEGDSRTVQFRRGDRQFDKKFTFRRPFRYETKDDELDIDDSPDMARISCVNEKKPPYVGYRVATIGANVCIYRPIAPRSNSPPVVRFLSFMYDLGNGDGASPLRAIKADHELLKLSLAKDSRLVLDLHENHGGMNPFVFLSWFAQKSWAHERVHVNVSSDFSEDEMRSFLWGNADTIADYQKALSAKKSEISYSFLCKGDSCNHTGPRKTELVTLGRVAVVTGEECTSSCDAFSVAWGTFGMGPLVGKQPMHGFTSVRHSYAVVAPDNRDLGRISIALSWEAFEGKPALEGRPITLDWEAPETFETRESWVNEAVSRATNLLDRQPR